MNVDIDQMSRQQARSANQFSADLTDKSIVLVGLMGAGKTCIGKRLADRLNMDFIDADAEIEAAAKELCQKYSPNSRTGFSEMVNGG